MLLQGSKIKYLQGSFAESFTSICQKNSHDLKKCSKIIANRRKEIVKIRAEIK